MYTRLQSENSKLLKGFTYFQAALYGVCVCVLHKYMLCSVIQRTFLFKLDIDERTTSENKGENCLMHILDIIQQ